MDFALPYTPEQERFREEVRTWLEENIPEDMKEPNDSLDFTDEHWWFWREKHKELAKKGWLYPTYPKEYGGGGLTGEYETIIDEEFHRARAVHGFSESMILATLLVWGTEEQKQKFLVPFLTGEATCHQRLTEPKGGADLASYEGRAVRDGDDWLLTGQNVFISAYGREDYLPGPMMTDPDAPRHRNLGYFMVPNPAPGLVVNEMELLVGHRQKAVFMDNLRVPSENLIGGDHEGWQVLGTHLEQEHGGRGKAFIKDEVIDNLTNYARDTKRNGASLNSDPVIQQVVMNATIDAHVADLLAKRAYWMYQSRVEVSYQGNVNDVFNRESDLRNTSRVRDVMGMYALLGTKEPEAPHGGQQEINQRSKAGQRHAGGSNNISKVILARRIGISRTQERPAPTPMTAGKGGG